MPAKALDTATLASPEHLVRALEAIRLDIVRAKDARAGIEARPVSLEIAQSRLFAFCDRIEAEALNRFGAERFTVPNYREPSQGDAQALTAAALADVIREEMETRIADLYRPGPGLSHEDRAAQVASLDAQILNHECAEEALIRSAERAGIDLMRRANADPRAVLATDKDLL